MSTWTRTLVYQGPREWIEHIKKEAYIRKGQRRFGKNKLITCVESEIMDTEEEIVEMPVTSA